jgi:hypothetical protein
MEAIYKCDALPDKGDDLAAYPETLEELTEGIEDLTTDEVWIDWCDSALRRLAKFGPQNMECENNICHTAVSVKNTGGITFFEKWCAENPEQCAEFKAEEPELYAQRKGEQIIISRPPLFEDHHPFRLIEGKVMLEEDTWIVTQIKIKDLPPEPEGSLQSP